MKLAAIEVDILLEYECFLTQLHKPTSFQCNDIFHQRGEPKTTAVSVHVQHAWVKTNSSNIKRFLGFRYGLNIAFKITYKHCSLSLKLLTFTPPSKNSLSASPFSPFPQIISNTYSHPVWLPCACWSMHVATGSCTKMEVIWEKGLHGNSF